MRSALIRLFFGLACIAAGVVVTLVYDQVFWFGAILVGIIYVIQGGMMIYRGARS